MKIIAKIVKYLTLGIVFGFTYVGIELLYRGESHISMFFVGAVCGLLLDAENEILEWDTPLWVQMLIGGTIVTGVEFISGEILTRVFGLLVWDYSNIPLNIDGVICLPFTMVWCVVSLIGILLGDYLRYWLFNEEKPRYKVI